MNPILVLFQTYFLMPIEAGGVKIVSPQDPLTKEMVETIVPDKLVNVLNDFPNIVTMRTMEESQGKVIKTLQSTFTMMDGDQQYVCMTFRIEVDMSSNGVVLAGRERPTNPWQGKEPDWAKKYRS